MCLRVQNGKVAGTQPLLIPQCAKNNFLGIFFFKFDAVFHCYISLQSIKVATTYIYYLADLNTVASRKTKILVYYLFIASEVIMI